MKVSVSFISVLLLTCSFLGFALSEENEQEDLPNIIFLFSDDQGSPDLPATWLEAIGQKFLQDSAENHYFHFLRRAKPVILIIFLLNELGKITGTR